jgi:hypothetical protein
VVAQLTVHGANCAAFTSCHVCGFIVAVASKDRGSAVNKPSSSLTGVGTGLGRLRNEGLGHTWLSGDISPRKFGVAT